MFYPEFNKSPADIAALNYTKFKALVNKHLESDYCDLYFKKEHAFGFFAGEEVFEQYVENSRIIFEEAKELIEQFYAK